MENIEKANAIEIDKLEEVTGGDELGRAQLYKYRCQRCGQKYSFSKTSDALKHCLVCGGKLEFIGVE